MIQRFGNRLCLQHKGTSLQCCCCRSLLPGHSQTLDSVPRPAVPGCSDLFRRAILETGDALVLDGWQASSNETMASLSLTLFNLESFEKCWRAKGPSLAGPEGTEDHSALSGEGDLRGLEVTTSCPRHPASAVGPLRLASSPRSVGQGMWQAVMYPGPLQSGTKMWLHDKVDPTMQRARCKEHGHGRGPAIQLR